MVVPQRRSLLLLLLLAVAIVLPPYFGIYYTRFATQIAIYGMAALSIDLLLGYTGLITFGQAALFGVGAYAAGMLTVYGLTNAFVVWPLAVLISMLFALAIGSLSLRTRGFQFIMVTLAFAQMVYYFAQSLRNWGGDDGFTMPQRDHLGGISLADHTIFYYAVLVLLVLVMFLSSRIVRSEFGMVIRGIRDNERRVAAVGFPPYPYKLVIFVIAGGIAGLAGALMANHAKFVSPAMLSWQLSGRDARDGDPRLGQFAGRAGSRRRLLSGLPGRAFGFHRALDAVLRSLARHARAARCGTGSGGCCCASPARKTRARTSRASPRSIFPKRSSVA